MFKKMNTFLVLFLNSWLSGLEFTKMLVRIANRDDPDQTAPSEAV